MSNHSVISVQLAQARKVQIAGRAILTAIHKTAVTGADGRAALEIAVAAARSLREGRPVEVRREA